MKRMTRQRQAILDCFEANKRPLSVEELMHLAADAVPHLNLATVYRNIKMLIEERKIAPVDLPGQSTRYERIGLHHHHHFLCHSCNKLFDVDGCPQGISKLVPIGFELTNHSITLEGYCKECV